MNGRIFTFSTEPLEQLGPEEAVQISHELLWAEAAARLIAKTLIDVLGLPTARMVHCKTHPRVLYIALHLEGGRLS